LKVEAKICIFYRDGEKARTVSDAISPDNINTPEGLSIETFTEDNWMTTMIKYSGENFLTLQSTIDDLLSCVSIAEKTISALKE